MSLLVLATRGPSCRSPRNEATLRAFIAHASSLRVSGSRSLVSSVSMAGTSLGCMSILTAMDEASVASCCGSPSSSSAPEPGPYVWLRTPGHATSTRVRGSRCQRRLLPRMPDTLATACDSHCPLRHLLQAASGAACPTSACSRRRARRAAADTQRWAGLEHGVEQRIVEGYTEAAAELIPRYEAVSSSNLYSEVAHLLPEPGGRV